MRKALDALKAEGAVAADATLTILEISKSSPAPLRLFEVTGAAAARPCVGTPRSAAYHVINGVEGYLCATGRAFPRRGHRAAAPRPLRRGDVAASRTASRTCIP